MSGGRTQKFLQNSGATMIQQSVTMIAGFIVPKIMIEVYGSDINGMVSSIAQFISYFTLVEAGISGAVVYSLYRPLAERDHLAINRILVAARNFYWQSGYIFVGLTCFFAAVYPFFVITDTLPSWEIGLLVLIMGVSGTLDFFTLAKYQALLTAAQKTYVISLASTSAVIVNTIIIALLSIWKVDIVLVRFIALSSVFLRTSLLCWYVRKTYTFIDYSVEPNNRALDKRWDALFLNVLGPVQQGTPIILTTLFSTLKMVSAYAIYNLVMSGINALLSVFISGLSASFGDVIAKGEKDVLRRAYNEFEACYYALIAGVYGVTLATITPFVCIYTKNATDMDYNLPWLGFLLAFNGLLYNLKTPQGMMVISAGLYKETKWKSFIQTMIVIVGGIVGGFFWGLPGILLGEILSNVYRDIDLGHYIPKHLIGTQPVASYRRMVFCCILVTIIYAPSFFVTWNFASFFDWGIYLLIFMIYAAVVVGIGMLLFQRSVVKAVLQRF